MPLPAIFPRISQAAVFLWRTARRNRQAAPRFTSLGGEWLENRRLLTATPRLVVDINRTPLSMMVRGPIVEVGGVAYFSGSDREHGFELWRSDGTAGGTLQVKDIKPGEQIRLGPTNGSSPAFLTAVGDTLFFVADDGMHGNELWKSDGTATGTVLVKDTSEPWAQTNPHDLTAVNETLFFISGTALWTSNGTAAGTVLLKDFSAGNYPPSSPLNERPDSLVNLNGTLFFRGYDPAHGYELWKSNGTAAGTVLVKDIQPGAGSSRPYLKPPVNGKLYFSANDGTHGFELWKSDGTEAGTSLVQDIKVGGADSPPSDISSWQGKLVFRTTDGTSNKLWLSDGTSSGTTVFKTFPAGPTSWMSHYFTNLNGTLVFRANDGTSGYELWKSDGTEAGTTLVKDIRFGALASDPRYLTNVNGSLYFRANDGVHGYELWKSDGTEAGTLLVHDLRAV